MLLFVGTETEKPKCFRLRLIIMNRTQTFYHVIFLYEDEVMLTASCSP